MKILIFNWRDIRNPMSGGAEILTHEVAKRWVKKGNEVIQISSEFPKSKREEIIDGVRIIRLGFPDTRYLFLSVHFRAFLYYMMNLKGKVDIVVDEIHGIPFFTPWYVKEKKVVLICEVSGDLWYEMFGKFFGSIGRLAEILYVKFIYKNTRYITISESTKKELISEGVKKDKISVLPMGITLPNKTSEFEKENKPTLIYVGRLSKSKGIEDVILALKEINVKIPTIKLWIVGRGDEKYVKHLKQIIEEKKIDKKVEFFGFVSDEKKFELMKKAHILIASSIKEGWGLIVSEAAIVGTPSVVYNVSGLRDVVKDNVNGLICEQNNYLEIAKNVEKLLNNQALYKKLQAGAISEKKKYNWDRTANQFLDFIK